MRTELRHPTMMCKSKVRTYPVTQMDERPVLQPACNRVAEPFDAGAGARPVLKKSVSMPRHSAVVAPAPVGNVVERPASGNKSGAKRGLKPSNSSSVVMGDSRSSSGSGSRSLKWSCDGGSKPRSPKSPGTATGVKKWCGSAGTTGQTEATSGPALAQYMTLVFDDRVPGSLAAAQREQSLVLQAQRKLRIAHYGRSKSVNGLLSSLPVVPAAGTGGEDKRCGFITSNSDPVYVAYHDEEWGVPVHDDNLLLELLVLSGAQVGMDWTTVLKKRNDLRSAFAGFNPDQVSRFTEKQMLIISDEYDMDLTRVRGAVDNAKRVVDVSKEWGSFSKYVWGFVNHKPLSPCYRSSRKVPVKTSKSESISKDMVRRGFRFVGPSVVQCFMQAAGLTNDHVVACPRHAECATMNN